MPHVNRFPQRFPLVTIAAILLCLLLALGLIVAMYFIAGTGHDLEAERSQAGREKLRELQASQQAMLNEYHWINKAEGSVGLPIERAMELLLKEPDCFPEPTPPAQDATVPAATSPPAHELPEPSPPAEPQPEAEPKS